MRPAALALALLLSLALPPPDAPAGERLLYLLTYREGIKATHNRLFALDPDTKEATLIFSDETTPIILLPGHAEIVDGVKVVVSSKNAVFAYAIERRLGINPFFSGYFSGYRGGAAIYELTVDRSNRFRKALPVEDIRGNTSQPLTLVFANPTGTLVGYITYLDGGPTVVIYEPATGRLVHRVSLRKRFLGNLVMSIGWMPDATKLYFTLYAYEPEAPDEAYRKLGTYLMNADGTGLVRLPTSLFAFPKKPGFRTSSDVVPICAGMRSDGTLLVREITYKADDSFTHSFLYLVNPTTKSKQAVHLSRSRNLDWFRLSHDGKRVAFMENQGGPPFNIWVKDLETSAEQMVASLDAKMSDGYWPTLVGWVE